jgi:transposase InsO family protein
VTGQVTRKEGVMKLFKRGKKPAAQGAGGANTRRTGKRQSPPAALEVKLLALEALATGLSRKEVAEIIGVSAVTIGAWQKQYDTAGLPGLYRKASSISVRNRCTLLEERILAHRRNHPEQGVRRIRDELRRGEALAVSAETVRTVVNEAGLGNAPPMPGPRPPQVRRFERTLPNALWQIDIFTFQLKRMYRVYLVGIIDDHSRYLVGWGLFRQQTADAVLEVVKGAIGQWGAPREILSDNGRQFVAWRGKSRFQEVLKQQGIGHVRSAPHHPMTLGKIERFWQTLWREFLHEAVFASFADACQRLDHWIAYYNHQRPHQGIDGACPADRFYGVAGDVEEALKQGCEQNALKLALGQEPQRPLYLLGQLGGTEVRVVRKGEDLEVKVGDSVREVIRLGAPYTIGEDGRGGRDTETVAGPDGGSALAGAGAGAQGRGASSGAVPDVWDQPADAVPGDGDGGRGGTGGAVTEAAWSQAEAHERERGPAAAEGPQYPGTGDDALAPEVRGDQDAPGPGAQAGARGAAAGGAERKNSADEVNGYVGRYGTWPRGADGPRR